MADLPNNVGASLNPIVQKGVGSVVNEVEETHDGGV
jgi:hypothetical protein